MGGSAGRVAAFCGLAAVAVVFSIGMSSADSEPTAAERGKARDLFDGRFVSISASKSGEPYVFVDGSRLRLEFRSRGKPEMVWRARCNYFGARVEISKTQLDARRGSSTEMGCIPSLERQDRWLARFFQSDPAWDLDDANLTLTSGDDQLVLEHKRAN